MGLWDQNQYIIKQKVLTLGRKYFIYDSYNRLIGYCKQKLFKLKEDIRIYTDDSMTHELLSIRQENILDFTGTFAVMDSYHNNALVGYVGRKAWKSLFRDTWKIFDHTKREIATIQERGGTLAVFRRFVSFLRWIPKKYDFFSPGAPGPFAEAIQRFQIIGDTWTLNVHPGSNVDIRLIVAAALMMDIIEQAQGD